jgi:hypothetical protein
VVEDWATDGEPSDRSPWATDRSQFIDAERRRRGNARELSRRNHEHTEAQHIVRTRADVDDYCRWVKQTFLDRQRAIPRRIVHAILVTYRGQ